MKKTRAKLEWKLLKDIPEKIRLYETSHLDYDELKEAIGELNHGECIVVNPGENQLPGELRNVLLGIASKHYLPKPKVMSGKVYVWKPK